MRRVSLNQRLSFDAAASDEVEICLIKISHPSLDAPIRLSTDATQRLSIEPLAYGTQSTWNSDGGAVADYSFLLMSAMCRTIRIRRRPAPA
ncbi:MAG TPA: hypothetical protein VIJ42_07640 [Stellaceae bacterium]